jgi:hypothetical protein
MSLTIVLVIVFLVCLAMMWNEGMWTNALAVINVTLAAMLATNYFEPLADQLENWLPSYTYLCDFLSLWLIFAVSYSLLRFCTDYLSKYRVRFKMPVEHAGRVLFAAWTGWLMICFTTTTLHTAPLARTAFNGTFQVDPKSNNFLMWAPDRMWLAFMQSRSQGALSRGGPSAGSSRYPADQGKRVFDPRSEFILKYGARRQQFHNNLQRTGSLLVGGR